MVGEVRAVIGSEEEGKRTYRLLIETIKILTGPQCDGIKYSVTNLLSMPRSATS